MTQFSIETAYGTIAGELFTDKAPVTTANFIKLVEAGFYNGLTFHRVEPGFVVQTGDPTATGTGGSNETIPLEIHPELSHNEVGILGMARTSDPNSASSQFYITLNPARFLDGQYAVFGKVTEGLEHLRSIDMGDKITTMSVKQPALV